jgi:hypothetical protein
MSIAVGTRFDSREVLVVIGMGSVYETHGSKIGYEPTHRVCPKRSLPGKPCCKQVLTK